MWTTVVDLHAQRLRPNQLSDNKISPWDTQQTAARLHWTHFFLLFCILSVFYHCPLYNPALSNIWDLCVWIWHKDVFVKFSNLFGFAGFMYLKIYQLSYFCFWQEIYWLSSPVGATAMHSMRLPSMGSDILWQRWPKEIICSCFFCSWFLFGILVNIFHLPIRFSKPLEAWFTTKKTEVEPFIDFGIGKKFSLETICVSPRLTNDEGARS